MPAIEPPAQPDSDQAPARNGRKTLVLWVVLLLMFVWIYSFFDMSPDRVAQAAEPCRHRSAPWPYLVSVPFIAFTAWFMWASRVARNITRDSSPGLEALHRGDLAQAEQLLAAVARKHRGRMTGPVARYNLALVYLRQGNFAACEAAFARLERWAGLTLVSDMRQLAASGLATVLALRGEVDRSRRWLDEAKRRRDRAPLGPQYLAELIVSELIVLAREGKIHEVVDTFAQHERLLEGTLSVERVRVAQLFRAFATSELAGVRDEGTVARLVDRLRTGRRDDFDHLASAWPALRAFLVAHDLAAPAA